MASSIYVSLTHPPTDMAEVRTLLENGFGHFGLAAPWAWFQRGATPSTRLTDGFIMVEGACEEDQCWISLSGSEDDLSDGDGCTLLADVQTRRNRVFAGVVAYTLCAFAGRSVFNDAGTLDGQERYTADSLEAVLARLLRHDAPGGATPD